MRIRPIVVAEFIGGVAAAVFLAWAVIAIVQTLAPLNEAPPRPTGTTVLQP